MKKTAFHDIKVELKILKSGFVVVFHKPDFDEKYIASDDRVENKPADVGINVGLNSKLNIKYIAYQNQLCTIYTVY